LAGGDVAEVEVAEGCELGAGPGGEAAPFVVRGEGGEVFAGVEAKEGEEEAGVGVSGLEATEGEDVGAQVVHRFSGGGEAAEFEEGVSEDAVAGVRGAAGEGGVAAVGFEAGEDGLRGLAEGFRGRGGQLAEDGDGLEGGRGGEGGGPASVRGGKRRKGGGCKMDGGGGGIAARRGAGHRMEMVVNFAAPLWSSGGRLKRTSSSTISISSTVE
jgi:hypothetical protein